MKKTYQRPKTTIVQINNASIICISGTQTMNISGAEATGETVVDVKSNNYNVWDDDWNR